MMKMPVRILLAVLCAVLILLLPFLVSSPNMLNDVKMELMNSGEDEIDFGRFLLSSARAEDDLEEETIEDGQFASHPEWALPLDFSVPPAPNKDLYTEDGYEDETIRVRIEHQQFDEGTKIHIAYVQIADASQLRTAVANPEKLGSTIPKKVSKMAEENHAVIAISGDNYQNEPAKKTFEVRMTKQIKTKTNKTKDILVIDDHGDFHLFIKSQGVKDFPAQLKNEGRTLVNAFTFGPALVKDGELVETDTGYGYNPGGREPRAAIGQLGPLSYVMVVVEARSRSGDSGLSHEKLAKVMFDLGCVQAFNLDGGNSAEMVFGEQTYKGMPNGDERKLNDIIFFATSQPE